MKGNPVCISSTLTIALVCHECFAEARFHVCSGRFRGHSTDSGTHVDEEKLCRTTRQEAPWLSGISLSLDNTKDNYDTKNDNDHKSDDNNYTDDDNN